MPVVLMAPLVRSAHWHLSNGGTALVKPFVKALPRAFRENSSDEAYLKFVEADPLHARRIPLAWVDALKRWNERAAKFSPSDRRVLIIQGDKDGTVDAGYNLPFLKRMFPANEEVTIAGGEHQLLNEATPAREQTLSALCSFLTGDHPR